MTILTLTIQTTDAAARAMVADLDGSPRPLGMLGEHYPRSLVTAATLHSTRQEPTYHGIAYAECFRCGYGTADQTTLEMWNDLTGECPDCGKPGRVLWVLKGGGVHVTESDDMGAVGFSTLRIGTADQSPPDAPGTLTGPELWPAHDLDVCREDGEHHVSMRHPASDCPANA